MPRYKASLTVSSIGAVDEPTSELHFKELGLYCFAQRPMFSLSNIPLYWFPRMKAPGYSGDLKPLCKTGKGCEAVFTGNYLPMFRRSLLPLSSGYLNSAVKTTNHAWYYFKYFILL